MKDDFDENELFNIKPLIPPELKKQTHDPRPEPSPSYSNPLAQYFRTPGIQVRLPSNGAFLPKDSVQWTANEEVNVYPFKSSDELLFKSPESLLSGYATESAIRSCVPDIKCHPKLIASADLTVLLLAMRAASYGNTMELSSSCPNCQKELELACHIPTLLATAKTMPTENSIELTPELIVYIRPYNLANTTQLSLATFNETRIIQGYPKEEQEKMIGESLKRLSEVKLETTVDCIMAVAAGNTLVKDKIQIKQFAENIQVLWMKKIEEKLIELNSYGIDENIPVKCDNCNHEWKEAIKFDPSSFFGNAS